MDSMSVVGSGFVGSATGEGFAKLGHTVIFYDISESVLEKLKARGHKTTNNLTEAIQNSEITFIAVPTPVKEGEINLMHIAAASENVGAALAKKAGYHLIVVRSTVVPKTTEELIRMILEKNSGKKCGVDFGLCTNPEFMTQIAGTWTVEQDYSRGFLQQDRIVIGEFDKKSGDILEKVYKPLGVRILRTDMKTAEMIKYASNCALSSRISYWNQIYYVCQKIGVDSNVVAQIVGQDTRIGKYGTVHGKAFGGTCLPKDLQALIAFAEKVGADISMLKAIRDINERIGKEFGVRE